MANRKVTDLINKDSASLLKTDVHYMVDTTDTESDPAGTSYKTTLGDMIDGIKSLDGGIANGISTLNATGKLKDSQVPASDKVAYDNSTGYLENSDINADLALDRLAKFAATTGQVKIVSGNQIKPTIILVIPSNSDFSGNQDFIYGTPLYYEFAPVTSWPRMEPNKIDSSIWDNVNNSLLENKSLGQTHIWRCAFNYIKPGQTNKKFAINIRFNNPFSNFQVFKQFYVSEETFDGSFSIDFIAIADSNSLKPPLGSGAGYKLSGNIIGDADSLCNITLESVTRISLFNTYVAP